MSHNETEVKYEIDCSYVDRLKETAIRLGGTIEKEVEERDIYYQHPCRDLLASDEAIRVRYVNGRPESLTYKGPRAPGPVKSRKEIIVAILDDPTQLLESLGFRPAVEVLKRRTYIAMDSVEVTIDVVKNIGCFAEIELREGSDASDLQRYASKLGLSKGPIAQTYAEMALARARSRD